MSLDSSDDSERELGLRLICGSVNSGFTSTDKKCLSDGS
jgi:hypothetical protein